MNHPNSLLGLLLVAAIVLASWPAAAETASNATDAYAAASTAIDLLPTGVGYVGVSVTAASIAFTPDGTPVVAHPAYLPLAQANHGFLLSVSGIPQDLLGEAATVRLLASGTVVGVQSIDTLVAGSLLPLGRAAAGADPAPQRNDNVLFTDIAIATPDSYQVEVDDANGVALLTSDAFSLLSADPLATGNANVNPTQVPDKPVQWSAIPPSQQPEAAAGPSTAPAADAACYVTNQYTWSKQGSATWAPYSNYNNVYDVNFKPLITQGWVNNWAWGLNDNCGYSYQADNFKWGNSATIYGKSDIVGTGSLNWGYSIDYKGGGNTESWTCYGGGACAMQGGLVRAYNAQSFMNTPTAASPQWNHIQNQNIPATSSCGTCSVLGKLAMAELQKIVHATPVVSTILDFVVPTDFTVQNYSEITSDRHGNGGGGVNINTALTSSKKQVDGEHSWRFNGYGSWAWGIEASNDLYGEFHACQYCGWDQQTWSYWWDTTHVAKVRAS